MKFLRIGVKIIEKNELVWKPEGNYYSDMVNGKVLHERMMLKPET